MNRPDTDGALLRALEQNNQVLREIALRCGSLRSPTVTESESMCSPEDVFAECIDMTELKQEQVRVLLLNVKKQLIRSVTVYQGTVDLVKVRVAELLLPAVIENAPYLIMVHNHPSGDCEPSACDIRVTRQLRRAAALLDIELLDHVVVATNGFVSLHRRGLGFDS